MKLSRAQIDDIQQEAAAAFWKVVASKFPTSTSGDFDPAEHLLFEESCARAIQHWATLNVPFPEPNPPRIYEGMRDPDEQNAAGECIVQVNGQTLPLSPSLKLRNHSPTGFSWGYAGSGPAQLSLAILLDYFGDSAPALLYYQPFKFAMVAKWPQGTGWKISSAEIAEVLKGL